MVHSTTATQPSGLLKAGRILLLVGFILHLVGTVAAILGGWLFLYLARRHQQDGSPSFDSALVGGIYLGVGILLAVGSIVGKTALKRAENGQAHAAWVRGLVSSLLPPLQVVTLVGAILCKVSPEGEAR